MLTGSELLATFDKRIKAGATEAEVVRACGYASPKNEKRVNYGAFYRALARAKGVCLPDSERQGGSWTTLTGRTDKSE